MCKKTEDHVMVVILPSYNLQVVGQLALWTNFLSIVKKQIPGQNILKVEKFQNLVENDVMHVENTVLQSLRIFYIIVLRAEIVTTFDSKMVAVFTRNAKT